MSERKGCRIAPRGGETRFSFFILIESKTMNATATIDWAFDTKDHIDKVADENGFCRFDWNMASTGSWYAEFSRSQEIDGDDEYQTVKVRVADHSTVYCSEDYSIVQDGGNADDHTIEALLSVFRGEFIED